MALARMPAVAVHTSLHLLLTTSSVILPLQIPSMFHSRGFHLLMKKKKKKKKRKMGNKLAICLSMMVLNR